MARSPEDRATKLLQAGMALSAELSLDAVLQRIIELAVDITGATYGALGVLGPDGLIDQFITAGITPEQRQAIGTLPTGRGILGVLIREARPLRIANVGRDPRSVGFPPNHPPMTSFLGAPVRAHGTVFGNIYLTNKRAAEEFDEQDEEAVVTLATQAGVAVENARLYEEARARERWLDAVREIATATLSGSELDQILALVCGRARELVRADLSCVATPTSEGGSLEIHAADGMRAESLTRVVFPMEGSLSGEVIRTGKPVILADASADPRAYQPVVRIGEVGPAILVPLSARGRAFGTLMVGNEQGRPAFRPADLSVVETFAGQAAVALEYVRAQRDLRRLAVMEDRERIAKELHDGVIQSLFAVGMGLQGTATMSADESVETRIDGAVAEIDRVIRDLRNYIFGLRPGILADRQLDQALRSLAVDFEGKTGVTTVVEIEGLVAAELSSRAADIIQLARESLSNVGRHAEAATCRVSLYLRDGSAVLEIDDDGKGFDPMAADGAGNGLRNLRDRASSLGGDLEIESSPAEGTTVRVVIPL